MDDAMLRRMLATRSGVRGQQKRGERCRAGPTSKRFPVSCVSIPHAVPSMYRR